MADFKLIPKLQATRTATILLTASYTDDAAVGDGAGYLRIPEELDGMDLVAVHLEAVTAGTTNTMDVQIYNVDNTLDMLSTVLTLDSGEKGSDTAATPAIVNTSNDHVNTNDVVRIDIDAVHDTPAAGVYCTLSFRLPV